MQSRELKCFNKIVSVCKNRGFNDLADDILKTFGPKYLEKDEAKEASAEQPKAIKYENKITFLESAGYAKSCSKCAATVEVGDPLFLHGKHVYHVLCGADSLSDAATDNFFYKRWLMKGKIVIPVQEEEQDEA